MTARRVAHALLLASSGLLAACQNTPEVTKPDYSRQLRPGESALRLITDPARMPDLAGAYDRSRNEADLMLQAIDQSITWFNAPSSRQFFPFSTAGRSITHEQARASVHAFRQAYESAGGGREFAAEIRARFDVYESVGYNGEGIVLYTGYYAPIFDASRTPSATYRCPLYKRPADLATDPVTGEPRGRSMPDGSTAPYPTRREIESSGMLAGTDLVWLKDELDAYIVQVNGSAKLRLDDGSIMYVGYAGKTDRPYTGLGRMMVDEGLIPPDQLSLTAIKAYFRKDPARVKSLIQRNESYVFFTEYPDSNWPAGSLGVRVTERATLATDKKIYPRGGVVLVDTQAVTLSQAKRRFFQFMMDQDTGGAIQAPGRADIFMGTGETAEVLAGGQYAEGRLYYFFLKPGESLAGP